MIIQRKRKHNIGDIPVTITFKEHDHTKKTEAELGSISVNSTIKEREQTKEANVRYISVNSAGQYQAKRTELKCWLWSYKVRKEVMDNSQWFHSDHMHCPKACTYAYSVSFYRESALRHSKHEA